ncbi:MAG: O-antigen ligase family protein [Clostridia bacterium]|nr:O-antigen ligase family protein [Clostridia bacterium]
MKEVFLLFAVLFVGFFVFEFIRKKPYHAMSVYYAGMFIKRFVLPEARVRESVMVQLLLMAICFIMAFIGYNTKIKKSPSITNIACMKTGFFVVGVIVFLEALNGYFSYYAIFSIIVDIYKVAEIFLFYFMFVYIWRTTEEMEKAVDLLAIEMCIFGFVEMFTTERGGVGLNMLMSLAPIIFALGFYTHKKRFWTIIVCSLLIVLVSKTRTYLLGFILAILLIFFFANGKRKLKIAVTGCCILAIGASILALYSRNVDGGMVHAIIERLTDLSSGFEEAGGYRIYEMETAWSKFLESIWIGKGYGYMEYVYIETQGYFWWGDFMHNAYLEILVKTGFLGLFLYGGGIIVYCKKQYQRVRCSRGKRSKETGFLIGGLAGTFCWLFVYFAAPLSSYGYVFIPGIMGLLYSKLREREDILANGVFLREEGIRNGR